MSKRGEFSCRLQILAYFKAERKCPRNVQTVNVDEAKYCSGL